MNAEEINATSRMLIEHTKYEELFKLAKKMRDAQKRYYASPSKHNIITAKQIESEFDKMLREVDEIKLPQAKLF